MIEIVYLADHPEAIPTLVEWFRAQWPAYSGAHAGRYRPRFLPRLGRIIRRRAAPWPRHRGRVIRAGMQVAREQCYERIFTATVTARGILECLGWQRVRVISHGDEQLNLYRCELEKCGPGEGVRRKST